MRRVLQGGRGHAITKRYVNMGICGSGKCELKKGKSLFLGEGTLSNIGGETFPPKKGEGKEGFCILLQKNEGTGGHFSIRGGRGEGMGESLGKATI